MPVKTMQITLETRGNGHVLDLTGDTHAVIRETGLTAGIVTLFVPGSTGGLTTIEFEPGAVADFRRLFDEIAPRDREYKHHETWGDDNGHAHVRAALLGPSLTVPFAGGKLTMGTWQQVIFVDFDTRPRKRSIVVSVIGE